MRQLRQYPVTLEILDDSSVRMVWDGQDEVVSVGEFFVTEPTDENLIHSLRCRLIIENKTDPTAQSVIDAIRNAGGLHTPAGPRYVQSITQTDSGYLMTYGVTAADSSYGLNIESSDLASEPVNARLLAWQIGAFLRFAGHTSLTPEALAAIHSRTFRGF